MSYLKDNTIIDFLCEVEKVIAAQEVKLNGIYYFVFGYTSYSHLAKPKNLSSVMTSFATLHQYEEFQAISEPQKRKIFIEQLVDPKADIDKKIYLVNSEDLEERKDLDHAPINKENFLKYSKFYEKYEDLLTEHIAFTEEHEKLQPIDLIMWGFFSSYYFHNLEPKIIFEKLLTIRQSETSAIINYNQKLRLYIKLYNDWKLDLNTSFAKLLENPSLGSKSLSSLIVPEAQLNQVLAEQLALEEKIEQEKARIDKEQEDNEGVVCNICLCDLYCKDEDVYILDLCPHCFHESCLKNYINHQLKEGRVPIKCPEEKCTLEFTVSDLKELLEKEDLEKFYKLSLDSFIQKNGKDASYCPTPGCTYAFILDPSHMDFKCPLCEYSYCLKCKQDSHTGDCHDDAFFEIANQLNYKACPFCKFWVEKTYGCRHMVCRCTKEFCYDCGLSWDPAHRCNPVIFQVKPVEKVEKEWKN